MIDRIGNILTGAQSAVVQSIKNAQGLLDKVQAKLTAAADAAGLIDWSLSVDSTVARAHQHATNTTRTTGGWVELHESADRAA